MKISAKTEYACIAVLELAIRHSSGEPIRMRELADAHGIPTQFLVQILLQLKGAGLVTSTRGASGGYQLVKSPEQITLGEVMAIVEGESTPQSNVSIETPLVQALLGAWRKADQKLSNSLRSVTFADLVSRADSQIEQMYYI
ncbi:MAG: Rrf2 family transcriptional regulator [Planctomycetes bacterium]|nr:Rrf2 family transcriptional regulator [Planctomycetota bacterium]